MGDIEVRNMAFMSKWWWKYLNEEEALWKKVMCLIHNWRPNHRLGEGNVLSNSGLRGAICRLSMKNSRVFKVLNKRYVGNLGMEVEFYIGKMYG